MSAAVSIDFGNSFTKVALRSKPDGTAEMAKDQSLTLDEYNFCIPTLASCKLTKGREQWDYGTDVLRHKESAAGLKVYRNWKPLFFRGDQSNLAADRRCQSASSATACATDQRRGLSDEQWLQVKQILNLREEDRGAIENAVPSAGAVSTAPRLDTDEEGTDIDAKQIGMGYFRWLREFIEPICRARGLGDLTSIPARISLPSFGSMTNATLLLGEILEEAGWCLAERNPALPEPYSNAIGIFTEGQNAVHFPGRAGMMPYYPKMFKDTGLLKAMLDAIERQGPKVAWTLIADVGGYTADFSMMGLDLEDLGAPIEGMLCGKPRLAYSSTAIGVTNLDTQVTSLLGEKERAAFLQILRDPDQGRLESFHMRIYSDGAPYRLKNVAIGTGGQAEQIRDCVSTFAEEIADHAVKFMDRYQYDQIDDLILTGGGCMIPAVRDELKQRLAEYGVLKTHMYVPPADSMIRLDCHSLPASLVRGATAIGGASIYFDYAD